MTSIGVCMRVACCVGLILCGCLVLLGGLFSVVFDFVVSCLCLCCLDLRVACAIV